MRALANEISLDAALPLMETLTAAEFVAFTDTRPDEERWELLDGVPDMSPSPSFRHQIVLKNLLKMLGQLEDEAARSWVVVPGLGLRVSDSNVPVPDLLIRPNTVIEEAECDDAMVAFEILSPSTAHRDRRVKRAIYTTMRPMDQYVVVVPNDRSLLSYQRQEAFEERRLVAPEDVLALPSLGVSLPLAAIFKGIDL